MFDSHQGLEVEKIYPFTSLAYFSRSAYKKVPMFTVRIWDLPTRLFHWALAVCVIGLVITGNVGGNAMVWHFRLGYVVLTLVLFRLVWGLVGGHWSRWASLPLHPRHALAYLRSHATARPMAGHNPLGSWSVVAMLVLLHILALVWHAFKKHPPLLPAMLHGNKNLPEPAPASRDQWLHRLLAVLILGLSALAVVGLLSWGA
jgi:cytochrome b